MHELSPDRIGKFTASAAHQLIPGERGGTKTRDSYIFKTAKEATVGCVRTFKTFDTEHGLLNEYEANEEFTKISGLIIDMGTQEYFPIDENSGATPDSFVKDFDGVIVATADMKCPTESFFDQKMMILNESKPEYQNTPLSMFVQAQMQMKAMSVHNTKIGHPPVLKHYLVRYLTSSIVDYDGNKIEINLPIESRMFWKEIIFDEHFYNTKIQSNIDSAAKERDLLIKIFKKPIVSPNWNTPC